MSRPLKWFLSFQALKLKCICIQLDFITLTISGDDSEAPYYVIFSNILLFATSEAFTTARINKIFSGYQPCQLV
jgi:hypothetical protein